MMSKNVYDEQLRWHTNDQSSPSPGAEEEEDIKHAGQRKIFKKEKEEEEEEAPQVAGLVCAALESGISIEENAKQKDMSA